jgi:Domain of unknown function (DUF6754)
MTRTRFTLAAILLGVLLVGCGGPPQPEGKWPEITAIDNPNDKGGKVLVLWTGVPEIDPPPAGDKAVLERAPSEDGPWTQVAEDKNAPTSGSLVDEGIKSKEADPKDLGSKAVEAVPAPKDGEGYWYRVRFTARGETSNSAGSAVPSAQWFDTSKSMVFLTVAGFAALLFWFVRLSQRQPDIYVRPIGGLAAVNEAIGRATEMGRPVLFVPGIADLDDPQTLAAIVILKEVAKRAGQYETPVLTPCKMPVVMTAAEEATRAGYLEAGQPDLYHEDHVRFLSDDQFAYCAGVNGIMLREKPATNLYIGAFWAESLILAETGFDAGAIQIAGTANVSQLPFFVAACDYTLIGEELYAASAYLSREPKLLGALKASDWAKVAFGAMILLGLVFESLDKFPEFKAFFE